MDYDGELVAGTIVRVVGNLIFDIKKTNGEIEPAFCGAIELAEMSNAGMPVLLTQSSDESRIIKQNVLFVKTTEGWIFADPKYNRALFREAFALKKITEFAQYDDYHELQSQEAGGIDFVLSNAKGEKAWVFVTSIYHKKGEFATFPQKINFFEIKTLEALQQKIKNREKAYILMIAPREDCAKAQFVWDIDASAAAAMYDAHHSGVNFLCYGCKIEDNSISLDKSLEIVY